MSDKLLFVSADGHAGLPPEAYVDYIEKKYVPDLEKLRATDDEWREFNVTQSKYSDELLDLIDRDDAIRKGGARRGWTFDERLAELDREGVVAEVVLPGDQDVQLPFFDVANLPYPPDLRAAGGRAYHRHLAEGIADSGGRFAGIGEPTPCVDLEETVKELRWIAEHGFVGVQAPGVINDPELNLPPISHPYYEPFWAACEDLGLVVNVHAGYGSPQSGEMAMGMLKMMGELPSEEKLRMVHSENNIDPLIGMASRIENFSIDDPMFAGISTPRRVLWQLMLGGVFDRHPGMRLVFTEMRADWILALLAWLDEKFEDKHLGLKLSPSEYWARQCYVTPSSTRTYEVAMRDRIGVDRFMFGMDFPHPEGTWPNTREWLRATFDGVPEDDLRKILGLNAIECYGIDAAPLQPVKEKIGLTLEEIFTGEPVDERLLATFHNRSGYSRPPEQFEPNFYEGLLSKDEALLDA